MNTQTPEPSAGDKKVLFDYDDMSRRVRKRAYDWSGSAWATTATSDERFVYDDWNVIMVLDGQSSNAVTRKYTWGLDLSGQRAAGFTPAGAASPAGLHNAGGIGGLLAAYETQGTTSTADDKRYWFMYDANGNVGQVLDATDTQSITLAAAYEYDAYGNSISATGTYAAANPLRFSTKWHDAETGLYYYGYRYYSPRLGRWMSRDPIEEKGGLLLFSFLANRCSNYVDPVGLTNITAAMCRAEGKRARIPEGIIREICGALKNATCCGFEQLCLHLKRHAKSKVGEACYTIYLGLCAGQ